MNGLEDGSRIGEATICSSRVSVPRCTVPRCRNSKIEVQEHDLLEYRFVNGAVVVFRPSKCRRWVLDVKESVANEKQSH
jgi:hypothetical protein